MKLTENTVEVINSSGIAPKPLQIHNAADATVISQILTDNLYSDPERTVLAEYASNAWDAHVVAGNTDTPIEITLPEKWGSHDLIFTDYGCGMSNAVADHMFSGVGASSKRDDNLTIGGFGLGCKSAYAIDGVEGFTVVTVKDGMRTIVSMTKDEKTGSPAVLTLPAQPTDQPNGTVVSIPIPVESIDILNSRVAEHFSTWEPGRVLVNGKEPLSIYSDGTFREVGTHGWISHERAHQGYQRNSSLNVISGGNAYKVSLSAHDANEICGDYDYLATGYNPFTIYLNVGIGGVDLSANRADVRLKRATRAVLKERYQEFAKTLIAEVQEKLDSAATEAEALKAAAGVTKYVRKEDLKWNGEKVPTEVRVNGAGYTYEGGKRSRSHNKTGERGTISLPVSATPDDQRSSTKVYIMDTSGVEVADTTVLTHLTTYIKTDDANMDHRFRVYFVDKKDQENAWVKGAITNGDLLTLDAAHVIEVSKTERKLKRMSAPSDMVFRDRETVTYPYAFKSGEHMHIAEVPMSELKTIVANTTGNIVLMNEHNGYQPVEASDATLYPHLFNEDDIVLVNKVNRKSETLKKRVGLDSIQNFRSYLLSAVEAEIASTPTDENEINRDVVNSSGSLRSMLRDLDDYSKSNGVEIKNARIKALAEAASTEVDGAAKKSPTAVARRFNLTSTVIEKHADDKQAAVETVLQELNAEQPILMGMLRRWMWDSKLAADMVLLINAKAQSVNA